MAERIVRDQIHISRIIKRAEIWPCYQYYVPCMSGCSSLERFSTQNPASSRFAKAATDPEPVFQGLNHLPMGMRIFQVHVDTHVLPDSWQGLTLPIILC